MKSAPLRVAVINAQRSLERVYRPAPQVRVPLARLEINLQAKWTGRWRSFSSTKRLEPEPL